MQRLRSAAFAGAASISVLAGCAAPVYTAQVYSLPPAVARSEQPVADVDSLRGQSTPAVVPKVSSAALANGEKLAPGSPEASRPLEAPAPTTIGLAKIVPRKIGMDFGGTRVDGKIASLFDEAGGTGTSSFWPSFVSNAFAAASPSKTCSQGQASGSAVPAGSADEYNTADFLPGLNGVPWGGMVNGSLIVLTGMAVLRSHSTPASDIVIEVYPHWDAVLDKAAAEPAARLAAAVRTYEAQNGLVFRAVVRAGASPIACLDLVIPYSGLHAVSGRVHYYRGGVEYVARFTPGRLRN